MLVLIPAIVAFIVVNIILFFCAYMIFLERKVAAWAQDRVGPNRCGPWGLFQSIADGLKFVLKEQVVPKYVDKILYFAAPAIALGCALFAFAVVPFGSTSLNPGDFQCVIAPGVDIGILFVFAIGSLTVYSIILAGWSSNNKYSFLGMLRSSAQVISYEIPLGLSVLGIVLLTGSLNLEHIIDTQVKPLSQGGGWMVLYQPLALLIFFTAALAENNRMPFDLPETEQELVGGFHTEYSAMKFGMFFLGEYTHMITISLLTSTLFFGGWHIPYLVEPLPQTEALTWGTISIRILVMLLKMAFFVLFIMLLRWTLPRFRFDQLMNLAWKILIPLGLGNLFCAMIVRHMGWSYWVLTLANIGMFVIAAYISSQMPEPPMKRPVEIKAGRNRVVTS